MKYFLLILLVIFELGRLSAQSFIGNLNPFPRTVERSAFADDTVKILAIMVSFQEDADGTTFGNGKFESIYTQNYGSDILDPLPHDKKYFESHLQFARNYFHKVSKGKLEIEYTVLPDTFSVSDRMRNYSPPPGSDDFTPIADFSVEAWTKADQLNPGFNFSEYDVFLIFHAGVGRDVSLPGSIGNERDLPSVYLSDKAFKEIYGESFEGIPVSGGSFNITNSMIIPETESRELETISGNFLFEITINGLICASIGSHIGLPDLFDTETGLSAIGRFGLMDGQSIFAYLGTYPPEPSPWSKIKLGWAEPVTMDLQNADVNLVTNLAATMSDTVILKVPLNSSEYYLVENRIRDVNNDGSTITYATGDLVRIKTFSNDTTGYRSFDVDSLSGVIVDVDEFDWAVPGNGIVIWHIDENVINEKIAENKVNTDKKRRGVDVEEADGVQDIGERFFTIFGDEVIGEGTSEDFWYADNPANLFENRFAKDTRPNTLTNTGANGLITIKNFSEIDNRMSFRVEFGDSVVKPLFRQVIESNEKPHTISSLEFGDSVWLLINNPSSLIISNGVSFLFEIEEFSVLKPSAIIIENGTYIYGAEDSTLNYWINNESFLNAGSLFIGEYITTPIIINKNTLGENELVFGTQKGNLFYYTLGNASGAIPEFKKSIDLGEDNFIQDLVTDGDFYAVIAGQIPTYLSSEGNVILEAPLDLVTTKNGEGNYRSIVRTLSGKIYTITNGIVESEFTLFADPPLIPSIILSDQKLDGNQYIIVNNLYEIQSYNSQGSSADNFPFIDKSDLSDGFNTSAISGDFEGDNRREIISTKLMGDIYAVDGSSGKVVPGFPISIGKYLNVIPSLFNYQGKASLVTINDDNVLMAWTIGSVESEIVWKELYGNNQNTSFIDAAENTNRINEFFPESRAYNYPNPVYEGTTNIRYYVSEDSKINIKIFDLAGDFVAELNDEAQGGMDNETVWDVGNIQSGVYFARIEANSTSGKTEQAVIKIAVVK
ncbi:MAG: T9SS type A sorting domain-containing protein [Ignavibacteriaceae bacterium]